MPFATVLCHDGRGRYVLIDLRSGAVYPVPAPRVDPAEMTYPVGMDAERRELYILAGKRLLAYRLPR